MSIVHAYSQTVADGTATSVVRPSDWNSAHNMVLNMGGNTAGTSQISGQDIVWAGGNNVTLSANGSTVSIVGPNTVAQTVQTQASGNIVGAGFTSTTTAGTAVVATQNSAGLSMAVPAYLTTAAQSNHSHNFATTTTGGSNIVVGTTNSAGATIGVPAFITTYANDLTSGRAGTGTTLGFTGGVTGSMTLNTNGLNLQLSELAGTDTWYATGANTIAGTATSGTFSNDGYVVSGAGGVSVGVSSNTLVISGGGGTINQTGPNIAVAGSTVTSGDVVFSNSNGVTFGMNGSTITASVAGGGGGGGATITRYAFPQNGVSSITSHGGTAINGMLFFGAEFFPDDISATKVAIVQGHSVQSSYNVGQTMSMTVSLALYSFVNDTQISMVSSGSSNWTAQWSTSSSTGSVIGVRELYIPMTVVAPPGNYVIAKIMSLTGNNASAATAHTITQYGFPEMTAVSAGAEGFNVATNASQAPFYPFKGRYTTTTNAFPATVGLSAMTLMTGTNMIYGNFYREYKG